MLRRSKGGYGVNVRLRRVRDGMNCPQYNGTGKILTVWSAPHLLDRPMAPTVQAQWQCPSGHVWCTESRYAWPRYRSSEIPMAELRNVRRG